MPVNINQVDAQIDVESKTDEAEPPREDDTTRALQRWEELARLQMQRALRTAAWGFDD
jgi:hypothetical protein